MISSKTERSVPKKAGDKNRIFEKGQSKLLKNIIV